MEEIVISEKDIKSLKWIKLPFLGCTAKFLGRNEENGTCGFLIKMEPGAELPQHGHPSIEQCLGLKGEIETKGKKYGPGSYFINPPANEHGPFKAGTNGWMAYITFDGPTGVEEMEEMVGIPTIKK